MSDLLALPDCSCSAWLKRGESMYGRHVAVTFVLARYAGVRGLTLRECGERALSD
jgi:hypothetical protein